MKNTIIIFDDDAEILQICAIILESKGFRVVTANNCDEVAQKIIDAGAHVILMDNSIPQSGGIAATRIIKETEATRHIPVIFFSANFNVETLSQQAGAEYHLAKPFDISQLESLVLDALKRNSVPQ
jgi:two-component system, OmpR family, alkaline phosphatase synthesis response regulator PhoP